MGDVIGDLNSRRGMVGEFIDKPGGLKLIKASVPLSEMFQYVSTLRGMSKGRAQYTMQVRMAGLRTQKKVDRGATQWGPVLYDESVMTKPGAMSKRAGCKPCGMVCRARLGEVLAETCCLVSPACSLSSMPGKCRR